MARDAARLARALRPLSPSGLLWAIVGLSALIAFAAGCGTLTGAGVGAAIGAASGYGAKRGALMGAGVGAAAGAVYDGPVARQARRGGEGHIMRHHRWIALAVLAVGSALAVGQLAVADNAADLDRHARQVDAAASGQTQAQVAGRIADQLNAQWAPNPPAYSPESVGQQRGPDKFGGWGGVLIGDLISLNLAKSMLAAPNNTKSPEEALMDATNLVMDKRQSPGGGWGRISQDLLNGQKLGDLMKSARPAAAAVTGQSLSVEKSAKGVGKSSGKAAGKTDQGFSNAFGTPALHATGVAVSGPGVSGGTGRGHDKDVAGKDVADKGGGPGGGSGGGEGHGGGKGGGGGGGNGGGSGGKGH